MIVTFLYYRKVLRTSYNINTLHRNLHKANFAHEQRRRLKNVLISANVINVCFCSFGFYFKNSFIETDASLPERAAQATVPLHPAKSPPANIFVSDV